MKVCIVYQFYRDSLPRPLYLSSAYRSDSNPAAKISDGLGLPKTISFCIGDADLLRRSMEMLHRHAYKLIWLNPLIGSDTYQPI